MALLELVEAARRQASQDKDATSAKSAKAAVKAARLAYAKANAAAKALAAAAARAANAAKSASASLFSAVSAAAITGNRTLAVSLVDSALRSLAPEIKKLIGQWLIELHEKGGMGLGAEDSSLQLRMQRPVHDDLRRLDPSAAGISAEHMLSIFSVRAARHHARFLWFFLIPSD